MTLYSHSRLSSYEQCPRKYAFRYIEKPDIERRTSIEAFMGKAVHDALESLYQSVLMERTPKWEEVRDFYERYWDKNLGDDVFIVRPEFTAQDYRNVGRRCLQDYFVRNYPFSDGRVLALEDRVLIDLDGSGAYRLQGFIDRLAEAEDGTIEIHDYKTSRSLPTQDDVDRERQLALYQIGIQQRWREERPVRLIWHYLRANRTLTSTRTREALEALKDDTRRLIDTAVAAADRNDFPPQESTLCSWCEFQSICPAKRHQFATAAMTPEEFAADDGVRIADDYASAKQRVDVATTELEAAKQMVLKFAATENLTRLTGHHASVSVNIRREPKLPDKKNPERVELEQLVRDSGLWDQVSDLERRKLAKALQTDMFDSTTKARLSGLIGESVVSTIHLKRIETEETDDGPDV
ncbi:MAG TPA: PD-(D/E)XK nuclease family protein [candidate division Zixibacteria bacterium]|jgi:putative RecB family exonuclease